MKLTKDILIGAALVAVVIIVYHNWILSPIIAAGDSWYYFSSMYSNHFLHPYSWYQTVIANGLGGSGFVYMSVNVVVALVLKLAIITGLGWGLISKLAFYIPFVLLSLFSSTFLVKKLFPKNKFWFLAPIIFSLNTYILMMTGGGQIITALSYALSPITLFLFIRLIDLESLDKRNNKILLIISGLSLSLQTILDLRIAFVTSIAIIIYLLVVFICKGFRKGISVVPRVILSFFLVALVNAYWLIPIVLFGVDPIKQLGAAYSSSSAVKFLSFANFENSLGLLHPYYPENIFGKVKFMDPSFLILPILAFASLLFLERDKVKRKTVLFFALLGIIGIFLGKGASEPFGNFYIWLFTHVPGFQLFRDSFKWYLLIALSYMILIPYFFDSLSSWLEEKFKFKYIYLLLSFVSVAALLFLSRDALFQKLGGTFKQRAVPVEYISLNNYLSNDPSFYRTLWVPNTMLFGYYSNNHTSISARDFFQAYDLKDLVSNLNRPDARQMLDDAGVKYVVVPQDTENEIYLTDRKYDEKLYKGVVDSLDRIPWLSRDKTFGKVVVYKTTSNKDHLFCDCDAEINYKYINPTKYQVTVRNLPTDEKLIFSESFDSKWIAQGNEFNTASSQAGAFNSFLLPQGSYSFNIFYSPQKYVDVGIMISLASITSSITVLIYLLYKRSRS